MTERSVTDEAAALPREPTAAWIRVLVGALTAVWIACLVWQVLVLPERVPTHFTGGGEPDGWSSRAGALAFSVLLPLLVGYPMPLISRLVIRWPAVVNAPNRNWWTATGPRLRRFERLMREDLWLFAASLLGLLVAAQVEIVLASRSADGHIPGGLLPLSTVLFFVVTAVLVVRMMGRRYDPQPELDEPESTA